MRWLLGVYLAGFVAASPAFGLECDVVDDDCVERTLNEVNPLLRSADWREALSTLEALKSGLSDDVSSGLRARLELNFSLLDYLDGDYAALLARAETALALTEGTEGSDRADALGTVALYHSSVGQPDASLPWLERELAIRRTLPPATSKLSNVLVNLGISYAEVGNFALAEKRLLEAKAFADEYLAESNVPWLVRNNLGYVYGSRNEYARAAEVYQEVVRHYRTIYPGQAELANVLANLAQMQLSMGRVGDAGVVLEEALAIQRSTSPDSLGMSRILVALGRVEARQGKLDAAVEKTKTAIALTDEIAPSSVFSVITRCALGRLVLLNEGASSVDVARGIAELNSALPIAERLMPLSGDRVQLLYLLGKAAERAGEVEQGILRYREAIDVLDAQSALVGGGLLQQAEFGDSFSDLYRSLALLLAEQGDVDGTLNTLAGFRARSQGELWASSPSASEAQVRQSLRSEAETLLSSLRAADADGQLVRVGELQAALEQLRQRAADLLPPPMASADLISQQLRSGQVLVSYLLSDQRSLAVVVGSGREPVLAWLPKRSEVAVHIDEFRAMVADPASDLERLQIAGSTLYRLLIEPIEGVLAGASEVLLMPDGQAYRIPFAALYDAEAELYLAERFEMSQLAAFERLGAESLASAFHGFAFASADGVAGLRGSVLAALPFAEQEVTAAASRFADAGAVYLGSEATPAAVLAVDSGVLHIASHAVVDPTDPAASFIALAPGEDGDGRLTFAELLEQSDPDAKLDLVVLSACETAVGPLFGGEGLVGLSKAFGRAGARTTVASLWAVADRSSAELMSRFYQSYAIEPDPVSALASAQRRMIGTETPWLERISRTLGLAPDYRHPYFWSAFVVTQAGLPGPPSGG